MGMGCVSWEVTGDTVVSVFRIFVTYLFFFVFFG